MPDVLLSIKPKYVNKIIDGTKKWEFRKRIWKKSVNRVYVYKSYPSCCVVGYFDVTNIVSTDLQTMWSMCRNNAGIRFSEFFEYFRGSSFGHAIWIEQFHQFEPTSLEHCPDFNPPQSFMYLEGCAARTLKELA